MVVVLLAFSESFGYGPVVDLLPGAGKRARFPNGVISGSDDQASDQCPEVLPGGLEQADRLLLWLVYDKIWSMAQPKW